MEKLWIALTVLSVAGLALFGWLLRKRYRVLQEKHKGYQPPQMRFQYAKADMEKEFDDMDQQDHALLRQFDWLFVPMLFYVGMALMVVTKNASQYGWMTWTMNALAVIGCVLGMAESVLLLFEKQLLKAASVCSLIKWICFGIWVLGMFAGLFIRAWAL